jgi:hypothetical protein
MQSKQLLMTIFIVFVSITAGYSQEQELFDNFQQLLPRGDIAAIVDPDYVSAQEANIGDSTWVLGVLINGKARAFSLNLLNSHEVVNDQIDTVSYAAVW